MNATSITRRLGSVLACGVVAAVIGLLALSATAPEARAAGSVVHYSGTMDDGTQIDLYGKLNGNEVTINDVCLNGQCYYALIGLLGQLQLGDPETGQIVATGSVEVSADLSTASGEIGGVGYTASHAP